MNFQYYGTRVIVIIIMCAYPYLHVLSGLDVSHHYNMQLGVLDQRAQMPSVLGFSFPFLPVAIQCTVHFLTSAAIQKYPRHTFCVCVLSPITAVPRYYRLRKVLEAVHRL